MRAQIINRTALTVIPKQPYVRWANSLDDDGPKLEVHDPHCEPTVYLIDEIPDDAALKNALRRHYAQIFENELASWHLAKEDWPQQRDIRTFREWFEVKVSTMVLDLGRNPLELEVYRIETM
jgi:hypothetical protein